MMARQHVPLSGLATLTIVSTLGGANPFIPMQGIHPFIEMCTPSILFALTLIGQAFGMVPDIDHPKSTITKKLGIVGAILQPPMTFLGGGHRKGVHSWVFVVAMAFLGLFMNGLSSPVIDLFFFKFNNPVAPFGLWIVALFTVACTMFSIRLILPYKLNKLGWLALGLSLLGGWVVIANPDMMKTPWLVFAMALGTAFHDFGDMLTTGKVPFLWPFIKKPLGLAVVGRTGSRIETLIAGPLITFGLVISYAMVIIKPAIPEFGKWFSSTVVPATGGVIHALPTDAMQVTLQGALIVSLAIAAFDFLTRIAFPPRFEGGH